MTDYRQTCANLIKVIDALDDLGVLETLIEASDLFTPDEKIDLHNLIFWARTDGKPEEEYFPIDAQ